MGKRKNKDDYEHIRRKIWRLESKLRRNKGKDRRRSESAAPLFREGSRDYEQSSDENRRDENIDAREAESRCGTPHPFADVEDVDYMESPAPAPVSRQAAPPTSAPLSQPEATVPVDPNQESTPTLPLEILNILGEANKTEKALSECILTELSERWGKILVDGLAKEYKESLVAKILIPANFSLAQAPKLNQEVVAVLQDAAKNRDKRLENAQNQLGLGIASLANLTRQLIQGDLPKLEIIKQISETSQILLDLHYEESVNRKKLILPSLDKKNWHTIQDVKRDVYLFGKKLGENIKSTKDIERSGLQIKKPFTQQAFSQRKHQASPGNSRAPPRQQYTRPAPSAPARPHEPQPSTSARRAQQPPRRGRPYASARPSNDRRRRY